MDAAFDARGKRAWVNHPTWRILAWIGVALQAIALVAVLFLERWHGAWTIAAFLALSVAFLAVQDRLASIISLLVVVATSLNAGGWAWNWFNQFVWFDEFIHTFTSFAVVSALAYVAWKRRWFSADPGSLRFVLLAAALGFGLGVLWEVVESLFLNLTLVDTIVDLLVDTIGAALGGWFCGWVLRQQGFARRSR